MSSVKECISTRKGKIYKEGVNNKVKLVLYKTFNKNTEFEKYFHGINDEGTILLFKFRSGTHSLSEELGRHKGQNGKTECTYCGAKCESMVHVLWEYLTLAVINYSCSALHMNHISHIIN